jgi:hypothetical protein
MNLRPSWVHREIMSQKQNKNVNKIVNSFKNKKKLITCKHKYRIFKKNNYIFQNLKGGSDIVLHSCKTHFYLA